MALLATTTVFTWIYPFPMARAMSVAAIGVAVGLAIGNRWMKPSIHCAGIAGIAVATTWVHGPWGLIVAAMLPIVAWARIVTTNHVLGETLVGAAIGAAGTAIACATLLP